MSITIDDVRFKGETFSLSDWQLYKVSGEDRENFLNGQTTNDISKLSLNSFHLNSRITRQGRVVSYFLLGKSEKELLLVVPKERAQVLIEDLEKFIIMDDVTLEKSDINVELSLGPLSHIDSDSKLLGSFYGELASLSLSENSEHLTSLDNIESLRILSGFPKWNSDITEKTLLNESILENLAIDYKKGCFLGQETVSKVHNGRGAAFFPVLLELSENIEISHGEKLYLDGKKIGEARGLASYDKKTYLQASLIRDLRVDGRAIALKTSSENEINAVVSYLPLFNSNTVELKAIELHDRAIDLFHSNRAKEALELLEIAVELKPDYADAIEIMGVILGQLEEYEKGLEFMDKLLSVDEASVMAHTNKSLFYMKLGKIEEAEEEKSQATLKSFKKFGEEAKAKKAEAEIKKKEEEDIDRRKSMFLQVLEIDEDDTIANYGMGDISYARKDYQVAKDHLEKVIKIDPKYSMAYLVLGKTLEALKDYESASEIYLTGIEVASKLGNMMPANEMQSRYSKIAKK